MLNDKTASFSLIRTNPKISGNVKITVDSAGDIWLNSIDANKVLSGAEFKKFRLSNTSSFEADLKSFLGKMPPEVVFEVKTNSNPESTSQSFTNQYEFFYGMGAEPLISSFYDEDYSYFAPLWLREDLPQYFVIFRVDEPLDFPYNEHVPSGSIDISTPTQYRVEGPGFQVVYEATAYNDGDVFTSNLQTSYTSTGTGKVISLNENKALPIDRVEQFKSIMRRAHIIKTFDLTEHSNIGKYIRNIRNNPLFPTSPITVRFEQGLLTTWNGISYRDGAMTSKGEYLQSLWQNAKTQIEFEEYITDGFERQGIICPMLLNLEFLFEDPTAPLYSIPRYFGFYVNTIESGSFQLDGQKMFDNRNTSGNTPIPKRPNKGFRDQDDAFFQSNSNGVRLYYMNPQGFIPNSNEFDQPTFEPRLWWVKDKNGELHSLNQKPETYGTYNISDTDLVLRDVTLNLGDFGGKGKLVLQGKGTRLTEKGRSYTVIRINDQLFPNDTISLYWNIGTQSDIDGPFDKIVANDLRRAFTIPAGGTTVSIYGNLVPYYNVGDELEIQYGQNGTLPRTITTAPIFSGGYTVFNINAAIDNSTTSGFIAIIKGWGPGHSLAANNYNPIYFHPFGTPEQVASAIASAFNRIEQRTWDAIAIGNEVVIRMRAGGTSGNSFFTKTSLTLTNRLEIQKTAITGPTQKIYFEGGTNNNHIRVKYELENYERLKQGEIFVKSKLGLAKIEHVGRFVDTVIQEVGGSDPVGIEGWDKYGVFYINDLLDEPLISTSKTFVAYYLYNVTCGLFSFFNIKDIDGDFFSSTYARSPVQEYHRYFDLMPDENVLIAGRQYIVMGDATESIVYNGSPISASPVGTVFTPIPGVLSYQAGQGKPLVAAKIFHTAVMPTTLSFTQYKNETPLDPTHIYLVAGNPSDSVNTNGIPLAQTGGGTFTGATDFFVATGTPVVIDLSAVLMDPDIRSFPGFFTFRDFLTVEEEAVDKSTLKFTYRDKFFFNTVNSEYDYLKENFLKETATLSRLVPTASKWVYTGGSDIRDNEYRLNVHPIFGTYNFSPSFQLKTQNPEGFTHEWYYLEGSPQQYPSAFVKDNYYFFTTKLDMDQLKDANPANLDYFVDYFTFQPTSDSPDQERYSIFEFNQETGLSETFFRGVKIKIKEVIRDTAATELRGIKPPFKTNSTRFNGYKFSSILRVHKEIPGIVESPVTINVVENQTNKSITFVIDVILEDYRTLTLADPYNLGSSYSPVVNYPDTLDASVDYLLLYSMKSKKVESIYDSSFSLLLTGTDAHKIGDIKLSVSLNLSAPSGAIGAFTYVYPYDNPDYDWDFRDEIRNFKNHNYFTGEYQFGDTQFPYPLSVTQGQVLFGIPGTMGYSQNPLVPYDSFYAPFTPATPISLPFGSSFEWSGFATYQLGGGNLYYEPIMQRISFASLAQKINEYSKYVKYRTYKWNGSSTVETSDEFYLEFEEPARIIKLTSLIPQIDDDKPEEFNNQAAIGVELMSVNSSSVLQRYDGPYEPKFRNILYFKGQKTDSILSAPSVDIKFSQATFNPEVAGFGLIQNMNYLKVSKQNILDLVNNTKYKSVYPLINEIAIAQRDHFVFGSSWDPGFWRLYSSKTKFTNQAGTREMKEVKAFLGSKMMKTQDNIRLQDFTVEQVNTLELLDMNNITSEIAYTVTTTKVSGLINIEKRLLRFFIENGAPTEFNKYLIPEFGIGDPDSEDDDVHDYLTLNVLPVYEVKGAIPFVKKYQNNTLTLPVLEGSLTDAAKLLAGYKETKNFTITKISDFLFKFEYTIDNSSEASIALSFDIGRI